MVGVDIMEYGRHNYVVLAVDYFTRKVFDMMMKRTAGENELAFVKKLLNEFKVETFRFDNGRAFMSMKLKEFFYAKMIKTCLRSHTITLVMVALRER